MLRVGRGVFAKVPPTLHRRTTKKCPGGKIPREVAQLSRGVMSDISVTTSVEKLVDDIDVPSVIQNLGTGILYVDIVDTVSASTGVKVAANTSIPVGGGHTYYGVSDTTADVRVLPGAVGIPG